MQDSSVGLRDSILDHISLNKEAYFKSQQLNDPDLTASEKREIAEQLIDNNTSTFMLRYCKYLKEEHLEYFAEKDDYEVQYHIEQRKAELKKTSTKATVRNRRLEAIRRLSESGEYFTDKEMKRRNPLLFEELVGQYLTKEQKKEFENTNETEPASFADYFMDIVERGFADSKLTKELENDASLMTEPDDPSQSQVVLWGEIGTGSQSRKRVLNNSRPQEVSVPEKHLLLNEFRSKMFSDFLRGKDDEFDYTEVDSNKDYDDLSTIEQDQQEDYFDSESPRTLMNDDSNSGG
ncbi:Coiled-coil domain containing protein (DUF2052) [Nesidiocoris tenuis]|uniref:Coiled-coil domain containing protein (DUF2052) n=1 Tax=Nesidiocoris tenuis TaxID=355587 RepID=A0ABN7AQA2_9HEMI|nr:Coiled-coil domain containing protein (DUF2052) [Nesidiocoris tenuis]